MLLKEIDDVILNGQRVIVRDTESRNELFNGYPFLGGLKHDKNIGAWWDLEECEVALIYATCKEDKIESKGEIIVTPIVVIEVYR